MMMMSKEEEEKEQKLAINDNNEERKKPVNKVPVLGWFIRLGDELGWSFVMGVIVIYGVSQGLGGALWRVATEYYFKDVQKVQPSQAQVYSGITSIPWIVKPIWGILTDVVPVFGYHRRPYFVFAGIVGGLSMIYISLQGDLHIVIALLLLTASSAGVAIADVTVDACVAQNSATHPFLAADLQSLCAFSSSIGALIGFSFSGILVHHISPQGVLGLLAIPAGLVSLVGILHKEPYTPNFRYSQVGGKFMDAGKAMWTTLKCPEVWRPCLYMYLSFAISFNIYQGMFYWVTDSKEGPSFSKETIGYIYSIGSVGSIAGAILYQYSLKHRSFRELCFWSQLLFGLSGMLDLALVLRINLKIGIPDYLFVVVDACVAQMIGRLKWMPLLVLSSKLCPPGIEGTLFALLMSIDNAGLLTSSWGGGLLLHVLKVTRTRFDNLWLAILIRNLFRFSPLCLLFLIPGKSDPNSSILPTKLLSSEELVRGEESKNVELVSLVDNVERA